MAKIFIDAEGAIYGRLCSYAAKKAIEGNEIIIVNSEKAVISGNKSLIIEKYSNLSKKGGKSRKGPRYIKIPYRMLKRGIRGMLPNHREGSGKKALERVKCYDGVPKEFAKESMIKNNAPKKMKYIELGELSKRI